jgi:hypothetical protein
MGMAWHGSVSSQLADKLGALQDSANDGSINILP